MFVPLRGNYYCGSVLAIKNGFLSDIWLSFLNYADEEKRRV